VSDVGAQQEGRRRRHARGGGTRAAAEGVTLVAELLFKQRLGRGVYEPY
jgi:hypothetical protein